MEPMPDVFISYSRSTCREQARRIATSLQGKGVNVFLDVDGIAPGAPFPKRLADALLESRVVVVLADAAYMERPWCLKEFHVAVAPFRTAAAAESPAHVVVALGANVAAVSAHLPPALAIGSWPTVDETDKIVALACEALSRSPKPLCALLPGGMKDEALRSLLGGGTVPTPQDLASIPTYLHAMPDTLGDGFVGRDGWLWQLFHNLETRGAGAAPASCVIVAGAGMGKTQLAAEYAWRYGAANYAGGVVWIDATGNAASVVQQLIDVLRAFGADTPEPANLGRDDEQRMGSVARLVESLFERIARAAPVLWIVDNVPEPAQGRPALPLSYWCPPRKFVTLLCTSRRSAFPDVDVRMTLDELTRQAAVDLVTRAPVQPQWLADGEWLDLVQWVGCLPLALRLIALSLAGGFEDAKSWLSRARGQEAAAGLDDVAASLAEEIPEPYVRGVTAALEGSYSRLAAEPGLQRAGHLISHLSPIPIDEDVLAGLIERRHLGRLANRGWIQAQEALPLQAGQRRWRIHRVAASFLRIRSPHPDEDLVELARWAGATFESPTGRDDFRRYVPHVLYVLRGLAGRIVREPALPDALREAARVAAFQLSMTRPESSELSPIRGAAVFVMQALGRTSEILDRLGPMLQRGQPRDLAMVSETLSALAPDSRAAVVCAEMLRDGRAETRRCGLSVGTKFTGSADVAVALLGAIVSDLDRTRIFADLPDRFGKHPFWELPQSAQAQEALQELGKGGDVAAIHGALVADLASERDPARLLDAVERLGVYLRALDTPLPTRIMSYGVYDPAHDEDLGGRMSFQLPIAKDLHPERYDVLVALARERDDPAGQRALEAVLWTPSGSDALSACAHELLDTNQVDAAIELSDRVLRAEPRYINAHWWRGLAYLSLKLNEEAMKDFDRVLAEHPGFVEALNRRARARFDLEDYEGALSDLQLYSKESPRDAGAHVGIANCLLNLDRPGEAITAAKRAIEIDPDLVGAWYIRALAEQQEGDVASARTHALHVASLKPDFPGVAELVDELGE
jgi:hypothetical protein